MARPHRGRILRLVGVQSLSLDLTTLRLMKYRDRYEKLARSVPLRALDQRTQIVFTDFGEFFKEFPDVQKIEPGPFMLWFAGFKHPTLKPEATAVFDQVMQNVAEDCDPSLEGGFMQRLVASATAYDLATALEKFQQGDEVDIKATLQNALTNYDAQVIKKVKNPQVLDPIEDLLKAEEDDRGLHWRLPCLNRHIKPLVPGDFVVVAGRPDKGKTTFCASELTCMAAQVDVLYPGERRSILWFNNEGPGKRIVTRCFQSALNATVEELVAKSNAGTIRQEYADALGGRGGTLRIFDIHGMWNHEVEDLMIQYRPALVLFDMVDNIRFGGDAANNGQRTDQLLEAMYQWARMMGVKHDCAVIATSQISADGDGLQWPTLPMLKDSKTGKQGAADVILTIGTVNDPTLVRSRYMGTTKNKKVRTGIPASPQTEVMFDGDRGRYVEYES
jgi:replicative DNA helicase